MGPPEPSASGPRYDEVWREVYGDMQEHGPVHRHLRRLLAGILADLDYRDAIDVGCGAGHNLPLLSAGGRSPSVTGADISEEALQRARRRADNEFLTLDIERQTLERSFDLVFSSLVLEHLTDDVAAIEHMRAMTRRHLVLATMAGDFETHRAWETQVGHVRNYRRGELEAKLAQTGLRVRRTVYWGFPFYSPVVRRLQNRWRAEPSFSRPAAVVARVLHELYRLNSSTRGDLLIVHASYPDTTGPDG